jgi:RNA polymerase sigma-70 factor (ECF subfamily)
MKSSTQPSRQALADLHGSTYRWALACCDFDEDRAQEVMQMAYLEILAERATFDGRSTLKTWLFAVVRHTALRLATGLRRARANEDRLARLDSDAADTEDCLHGLEHSQTRHAILEALQRLSPQQRQLVELIYYHDMTVAEAAAVMGVGIGTARQHFHRAKRALAKALWPLKEALGDT